MNILALSGFINGFLILFFCIFVYFKNRQKLENKIVSLACFGLVIWGFFYGFWQITKTEAESLIFLRILMSGPLISAVAFCYFSLLTLNLLERFKIFLKISYLISFLVFISIFTPFFINKETTIVYYFSYWPIATIGINIEFIWCIFLMVFSLILLTKKSNQFSGYKKAQIEYWILAGILWLVGVGSNVPPWYGIYFPPYGNFLIFLSPLVLTYAIIRYRFMDIRFITGRTFVYLLSIISVFGLVFFLIFLNNKLQVPVSINIFAPIATAIGILFFQPVFQFFEKLASKYFYYTFYSYQTVLTDLGKKLTQVLDLDRLSSLIVNTLTNTMKLDRTVILLRLQGNGDYRIQKNIGFREENGISLVRDNFLTAWLEKNQAPLVYEELSLIIKDAFKKEEKESLEKIRENMKKIEAALCLPLFIENKISGMIVLGNKISGDPYSQQDISLLNTLANQSSIALQNAKLYDQVHDLSENLQEKIDAQTKELKSAYEELKVLDKAKSEFISLASHQLRTPLTAIKGYISMILEGSYGKLPGSASKPLNNVLGSTERLVRIVNDLLNISKIELGKMELNKAPAKVEELITACYEEMEHTAEIKGLKIIWNKPKSHLPEIEIDKLKISQVISNLIDNAIKYTQKGQVEIKAEKTDSVIRISIKDTGEGLTEEELKMVFEGFTRGAAGIAYWIEGAGLGLYIAKKYIDLHHGKIWVESEGKGKGSAFYTELPIN